MTALPQGAQLLARAIAAGTEQLLLRGRRIALLCATDRSSSVTVQAITEAAERLGASLARVRVDLIEQGSADEVARAARVLGRLYDVIVCDQVSCALIERLRAGSGLPVVKDVATRAAPPDPLAFAPAIDPKQLRFEIQAHLLDAAI